MFFPVLSVFIRTGWCKIPRARPSRAFMLCPFSHNPWSQLVEGGFNQQDGRSCSVSVYLLSGTTRPPKFGSDSRLRRVEFRLIGECNIITPSPSVRKGRGTKPHEANSHILLIILSVWCEVKEKTLPGVGRRNQRRDSKVSEVLQLQTYGGCTISLFRRKCQ